MKKVKIEKRLENAAGASLADDYSPFAQIAATEDNFDLRNRNGGACKGGAFSFWTFAKYLLFYVPGVTLLYLTALFMCDYLFVRDAKPEYFIFSFAWLGVGAFLIMLGIGKLAKLQYLKVVAAVTAASFAVGVALYSLPRDLRIEVSYYPIYLLPVIALVGYSVKKRVDRESGAFL